MANMLTIQHRFIIILCFFFHSHYSFKNCFLKNNHFRQFFFFPKNIPSSQFTPQIKDERYFDLNSGIWWLFTCVFVFLEEIINDEKKILFIINLFWEIWMMKKLGRKEGLFLKKFFYCPNVGWVLFNCFLL